MLSGRAGLAGTAFWCRLSSRCRSDMLARIGRRRDRGGPATGASLFKHGRRAMGRGARRPLPVRAGRRQAVASPEGGERRRIPVSRTDERARAPIKPGPHRSGPVSGSVTLTARRLAPTPNPSRRPMRHPAPSSSRLRAPRRPSPSRRRDVACRRHRALRVALAVPATCFTCDFVEWTADAAASFAVPAAEPTACRTANRVAGCRHAADRLADAVQRAANGVARARTRACRIRAGASLHAHAATEQRRLNLRADTCGTLGTGLGRLCESSRSRHRRQCSTHQNRTNRVHGHSPQRRCCCGPPSCGLSCSAATCGRWS